MSGGTPLNSQAVTEVGSKLDLTAREIPATVQVVDRQTIEERGYHTVTEALHGIPGVTSGNPPGEPVAIAMRGLSNDQLNVQYNGIRLNQVSSRPMDTFNLDRVEVIKGPASLISGEGATGGVINYVTKSPHTGPVENEAFVSYDSLHSLRGGIGSGGSTSVQGLDYRFDVSRSLDKGFIEDTHTNNFDISSQLNYRVSETFKVFGAVEYRNDDISPYWGTPLVSAAFSGPNALNGIVSGNYVSRYNGTDLGAVTIDRRTLTTNYNVLDHYMTSNDRWVRFGYVWDINPNLTTRSQIYSYNGDHAWFNSEIAAFNASNNLVDRERFFVAHDHKVYGGNTDVIWNSVLAGMDNRAVVSLSFTGENFVRPGAANFPHDFVTLVNPDRGTYGLLTISRQTAHIDTVAAVLEDRLKITPTFSLVGGLRLEQIALDRTSTDVDGASNPNFPFSKTWTPLTGRIGYTWEAVPGMTFYGQYATAADVASGSVLFLDSNAPLNLTRSRTYETGVKHLLWGGKAEWSFAAFDIERKNVFAAQGGQSLLVAGAVRSKGVEFAAGVRPTKELNIWGNVAYVDARYTDFEFDGGSFTGNITPNVPHIVVNGGASYRFDTRWPVEFGVIVRHVGDRFNSDANTVKMLGYTTADAYMFVDLEKPYLLPQMNKTRLTFRVRNLTDEKYAVWGSAFYPNQILLGAPRTYEVAAHFKF